ncbi:hypothetical protein RCC89_13245 [Cytophagaceae bacterium ABcell3]|nr:hypothetical protein RCC89_13245 [Cytophagaceae bacterium ABcell3]
MQLQETTIRSNIKSLGQDQLAEIFSSKSLYNGRAYYEGAQVEEAVFSGSVLSGKVLGRAVYDTSAWFAEDGSFQGRCNCLAPGNCKHIAALVLYAINEEVPVSQAALTRQDYKSYLENLEKEELIEIILSHAKQEFFDDIQKKQTSQQEALQIFKKVEKRLVELVSKQPEQYGLEYFSDIFDKNIGKLRGLEHHLVPQLKDFIFTVVDHIGDALSEGYLYDHYLDEHFDFNEDFYDLTVDLAKSLSLNERISFLSDLDKLLYELCVDLTIRLSDVINTPGDLPELKKILLNNGDFSPAFSTRVFNACASKFSSDEQIAYLEKLEETDKDQGLRLATLYQEKGLTDKAEQVFQCLLSQNSIYSGNVYKAYLNLLGPEHPGFMALATEALEDHPYAEILNTINEIKPEALPALENILKNKNSMEYVLFLEGHGRFKEAAEIAFQERGKVFNDKPFEFFKRHKKLFPEYAGKLFTEIIDKNLETSGEYHYYKIDEALRQLIQIDEPKAREIIAEICVLYKRRQKLTGMLRVI